jgi:hypothetical protein
MKRQAISMLCALAALTTGEAMAADPPAGARVAATPRAAKIVQAPRIIEAPKVAPAKDLPPPPALPVSEIVERNVAARGGLTAWRGVTSLTLSGEMDAGGTQDTRLPFVMSMKRPQKNRLELKVQDQTALQVWDGKQGWKVRPFLERNEVERYTPAEARSAAAAAELDGPLVDFERKGTRVELAGTEVVDGRNTYRLTLTPKGGEPLHLWIDAKSFLEAKIEGEPRRIDGRMHKVAVLYRDFRPVGGLQIPHTLETVVEAVAGSHKLVIQKVKVNPPLDDTLFSKPPLMSARLVNP